MKGQPYRCETCGVDLTPAQVEDIGGDGRLMHVNWTERENRYGGVDDVPVTCGTAVPLQVYQVLIRTVVQTWGAGRILAPDADTARAEARKRHPGFPGNAVDVRLESWNWDIDVDWDV